MGDSVGVSTDLAGSIVNGVFSTIALGILAPPTWLNRDESKSHKGADREGVITIEMIEGAYHLRSIMNGHDFPKRRLFDAPGTPSIASGVL